MASVWLIGILSAVGICLTSADVIPAAFLHKRSPKLEVKKDTAAYTDEMFNYDTLAGIGLGKRSASAQRYERPHHKIALVLDLYDLLSAQYEDTNNEEELKPMRLEHLSRVAKPVEKLAPLPLYPIRQE